MKKLSRHKSFKNSNQKKCLCPEDLSWYQLLPTNASFSYRYAIDLAACKGISNATAEKLLKSPDLFKQIKTGWYERRHL